jgi:hypothetical protein
VLFVEEPRNDTQEMDRAEARGAASAQGPFPSRRAREEKGR